MLLFPMDIIHSPSCIIIYFTKELHVSALFSGHHQAISNIHKNIGMYVTVFSLLCELTNYNSVLLLYKTSGAM
jgi:hypothetical protein